MCKQYSWCHECLYFNYRNPSAGYVKQKVLPKSTGISSFFNQRKKIKMVSFNSWLVFICLRMKRKCIQFNLLMLLWSNKRRLYSFKSWQMNIDMWSFKNCRKESNWLQKIINNPCLSLQGGTAILNLLTCTVP